MRVSAITLLPGAPWRSAGAEAQPPMMPQEAPRAHCGPVSSEARLTSSLSPACLAGLPSPLQMCQVMPEPNHF